MNIRLPISKSIANRQLLLWAVRGWSIKDYALPDHCPDDVVLLYHILKEYQLVNSSTCQLVNCQNCGTAFRFLTAFFASQEGCTVRLTGDERMLQRPIGQLVSALQSLGADIAYDGEEGYPPLLIKGKHLQGGEVEIYGAESSQFVSALMLISSATEQGITVKTDDTSPYIDMTRKLINSSTCPLVNLSTCPLDWSSAAFWYEYIALYGGSLLFDNLHFTGLQGDECVAEVFAQLGVQTEETEQGIRISRATPITYHLSPINFQHCPDLYPAVYMTCQRLGIQLLAEGVERLQYKESDRLHAFEQLQEQRSVYSSYHDHRVAMALLIAGYPIDETDCISKSYPQFMEQYRKIFLNYILVIPCRNITHLPLFQLPPYARAIFVDDHSTDGSFAYLQAHFPNSIVLQSTAPQGKKGALLTGIREAQAHGTEYVWLTDYDTLLPQYPAFANMSQGADLYILPLIMNLSVTTLPAFGEGGKGGKVSPSLLERLQVIEYIGIQSLTISTVEQGRAVMASGANLLVRTETWLDCYPELHLNEPSGDDMYLLEAVKRKGLGVGTMRMPIAQIEPIAGWRAFFRQRTRWAGKAPHYTDKDILRYGRIVLILNVLAVLLPIPFWLVKFACEWYYLCKGKIMLASGETPLLPKHTFLLSILLSIAYPWYMLACLIGGTATTVRHW